MTSRVSLVLLHFTEKLPQSVFWQVPPLFPFIKTPVFWQITEKLPRPVFWQITPLFPCVKTPSILYILFCRVLFISSFIIFFFILGVFYIFIFIFSFIIFFVFFFYFFSVSLSLLLDGNRHWVSIKRLSMVLYCNVLYCTYNVWDCLALVHRCVFLLRSYFLLQSTASVKLYCTVLHCTVVVVVYFLQMSMSKNTK